MPIAGDCQRRTCTAPSAFRATAVVAVTSAGAPDGGFGPQNGWLDTTPGGTAVASVRHVSSDAEAKHEPVTYRTLAPLFGHSSAMRAVRWSIEQVADTDATVLIRGESGVGKELVAKAIHAASLRRVQSFVKVNCAALPAELLESELFGHEKGAFTGAYRRKLGKFEIADSGTIFLDEIGDMPLGLQAKLLHVLQDHEFARV